MTPGRRSYLKVRRWIDRDLGGPGKPRSHFLAMLPALPGVWLLSQEGQPEHMSGYVLCGVALAAIGFVVWRGLRLLQVARLKSGRHYERTARYDLPPEYADSEDALMAAIRGKSSSQQD